MRDVVRSIGNCLGPKMSQDDDPFDFVAVGMAMMGQPVEERRRHFGMAKDARPFAEAQVGCNDDAGALIELGQQME